MGPGAGPTDFTTFRPYLEKIVELKRAEAECVGFAREAYDALLEDHEPGMTTAIVARLFDALQRELVPLAGRITESARRIMPLRKPFPVERQRSFCESVALATGFDGSRGRFDLGVHPCCIGIGPGDCRLVSASTPTTLPAGCSRYSTRSATAFTSKDWTRSTTERRWAKPRRWEWTRHRPGSGRIAWDGASDSGSILSGSPDSVPRGVGRDVSLDQFLFAGQSGAALVHPGQCGRGDLQSPHPGAVRAGAGADLGRPQVQ